MLLFQIPLFASISPEIIGFATSFLFVFAIVFALLVQAKLFSESRAAMGIISAVIAFFTAVSPAAAFIQGIIPIAAVGLVIVFFIVFLQKQFGKRKEGQGPKDVFPWIIAIASLLIVVAAVAPELMTLFSTSAIISGESVVGILVAVAILLIFVLAYKLQSQPQK